MASLVGFFFRPSCLLALAAAVLAVNLGLISEAQAQRRSRPPPSGYVQFGRPDQEEGRRVLEQFRQMGIAGDYALLFRLRDMPRRGDERMYQGVLHGTRTGEGPLSLVSITPAAGSPDSGSQLRLLVQSGPKPEAWHWRSGEAEARRVSDEALFEPIFETDLSAFDLQMPFLYWEAFTYEGLSRLRGRPTHVFMMDPPEDFPAEANGVSGVRVYIDTQFGAMVQAEVLAPNNSVARSIIIQELKKVNEQWMARAIDVRNEVTRDRTRFEVAGAALGLAWERVEFTPGRLSGELPEIPEGSIVVFD